MYSQISTFSKITITLALPRDSSSSRQAVIILDVNFCGLVVGYIVSFTHPMTFLILELQFGFLSPCLKSFPLFCKTLISKVQGILLNSSAPHQ